MRNIAVPVRGTAINCLSHNPNLGLDPQPWHVLDWELNLQPLSLQVCTQSTESHQPELQIHF